ncbi:hypothetical protein MPSEU_000017700 [Mayamaea pseudoterrestris]|nr:hypothetical protein MPSEU_000017700 [Mayamaea pseudoterrestris]
MSKRLQKRRQFTLIFVIFFLILSILIYTLFWVFHHFQCYHREHGIVWREAPIHGMTRTCPPPTYETIAATSAKPQNICLTTLTDRQSPSLMQRMVRCRDFDALELISFPNQRAYASKHNYQWTDSSHMVDPSRPPAWSKILAVQHLLEQQACDWVLWLDADVLVMNSNVRIERLLPSDPNVMLVATHDRKYTVNSGVWLIRNSAWSRQFLKNWWNLKSWVRRPGLSLSGDNAAFGHLVDQVLRKEAWRVQIPARCNMNSFGVFLSETQYQNIVVNGGADALNKQEWYLSDQFYHQGDFIVHASGIDKKKEVLEMLLEKAI